MRDWATDGSTRGRWDLLGAVTLSARMAPDGPLDTAEMHISFPNKDHQNYYWCMYCIPIF